MTSDGYRGFQSDRVRKIETRERWKVSDGDPSGSVSAAISTYCWDYTNDNLYVNNDGATAWTLIGGTGGVTGSGTTPELAYWTGANTIGSATDIEFIAGGGLDFQGGASAIIQFADNTGRALSFFDAGGLLYQNFNSTNAQPETTFNELGANIDLRMEGDTDTHLFFLDAGNDRIGISTSTPDVLFHVEIASAGIAPAWNANDIAIFENSSNAFVQVFSPAANSGSYAFSSPTQRRRGEIRYNHSVDELQLYTVAASRLRIDASGDVSIGNSSSFATLLNLKNTQTLSGNISDGYNAAITIDPSYTGAFTVTRHNYIDIIDATLISSAALTNAAVFRFDAAFGTHKALPASFNTTDSNGDTTTWAGGVTINVNGTLYKLPAIAI